MTEWRECKLKELADFNPTSLTAKNNLKFINYLDTGNITKGKINTIQYLNLLTDEVPSRAKRVVKKNDIVYSTVRPNQEHYGIIKNPVDNMVVSTGFAVLRSKEDICYSDFLYYFLTLPENTEYLSNVAEDSTTAYPAITPDVIMDMDIFLPSLPEQKAIAEVLSSLDDKIDLLTRQNNTLEDLGQAYFRRWFLEENDNDTIMVSEIAKLENNSVSPKRQPLEPFHHYSIPAYDNAQTPVVELGNTILSNKFTVQPNSILVSKLNPITPRIWRIDENVMPNSVCSTEFQVLKPYDIKHYLFLYFLMKSDDVVSSFAMSATGTSGSHQRIRPEYILEVETPEPDNDKLILFNEICTPMMERVKKNQQQIITLQKLRDTLLPKLISGEVRVKQ
jgi:type I restriction enzyme S subunit